MEVQTIKISEQERKLVSEFIGEDIGNEIDFNRLMPVVEKIEDDGNGTKVSIFSIGSHLFTNVCTVGDIRVENYSKIEATWQAVIQFIQWYNQQKVKA